MLEKTDLESIKNIAKTFLYLDLKLDKKIGFIVHHPFFSSAIGSIEENGVHEMLDLTSQEGLRKARFSVEKRIREVGNYREFLIIMNTPYLPVFFQRTSRYLSISDFSTFLSAMWTYVEFPNADANVTTEEFVSFFKSADPKLLMEDEDYATWETLPEEITVYRGISGDGKVKKLSWTLSEKKAHWFADRWSMQGSVYRAKIRKEDVFAYFDERGEKEVVLDPKKLFKIEKL